MDYLQEGDVHFPETPSEGRPTATEELSAIGIGQDAVTLIQQLPYLDQALIDRWSTSETGVPIAPHSQVVNYRPGCLPDTQDLKVKLGEHDFKISRAGPEEGADVVYRLDESAQAQQSSQLQG